MNTLLICVLCIFTNTSIVFNKLYDRNADIQIPTEIVDIVKCNTKNMDFVSITNYCNTLTCELLAFDTKENITLNLYNSRGHCITYSKICTELCNIAYEANNINASAKIVVGYFTFLNLNINELVTKILPKKYKGFFINHDVVEITYENKTLLIDPSFRDVFKIPIKYEYRT